MQDFQQKLAQIDDNRDVAIVIGGEGLSKVLKKENKKMIQEFMKLADSAAVVLACRVSPK